MDEYQERLTNLKKNLFIEEKRVKLKILNEELEDEKLWKDWEKGQKISQDLAELKKDIEEYEMLELMLEEKDFSDFEAEIKKMELKTYFNGKHDAGDAILSIHAGQGGTEAMDWASMLYRMDLRFSERMGWLTEMLEVWDETNRM